MVLVLLDETSPVSSVVGVAVIYSQEYIDNTVIADVDKGNNRINKGRLISQ